MASKYGGYDEERGGGSGKGKVRGGRDSSPRGGSRGDYGRLGENNSLSCDNDDDDGESNNACRGPRMPNYDDRYDSR